MICNARMYAMTPGISDAWRTLLMRVGERAGLDWRYEPHAAPAPMRSLWDRSDNGCVFMCGLPYITEAERPLLLAAPVPNGARYENRPIYFSEFFVREDSPITDMQVASGTRLAHMLPESNSGYNAPRHHLRTRSGATASSPFVSTEQLTPTPMSVIQAVSDGRAEVGVVDSYLLDLLRAHAPEVLAPLRTIATTEASPIPVLIASPGSSPANAERARAALLSAHEDAASREAMAYLLLSRFAAVSDDDYAVLAQRRSEADLAGFALARPALETP